MDQENALDLLYHALREMLPDKNAKELSEAAMTIYQSLQDELHSTPNTAAQALRAIPSDKRSQASRENGKKGGRPKIDKSCPVCGTWMLDPLGCNECGYIIPSGK